MYKWIRKTKGFMIEIAFCAHMQGTYPSPWLFFTFVVHIAAGFKEDNYPQLFYVNVSSLPFEHHIKLTLTQLGVHSVHWILPVGC